MPDMPEFNEWRFSDWLLFYYQALGVVYTFLLPLSVIVSFWLIVRLTRSDSAVGRSGLLGITTLLPFGVGLLAAFTGALNLALMTAEQKSDVRTQLVSLGVAFTLVPVILSIYLSFLTFGFAHYRAYRLARQAEQRNAADSR